MAAGSELKALAFADSAPNEEGAPGSPAKGFEADPAAAAAGGKGVLGPDTGFDDDESDSMSFFTTF